MQTPADSPLRMGILGAARIAPMALVRPARVVPGVRVVAVAARDGARANRFAAKQGIGRVHDSYDALLEDPEIDAVYNPLPNALHCEWTLRALAAGKHVLCEKPLASNAEEAERMAAAAKTQGRVLVEAFHWRYHALAARMREILDSGELGPIRHVEVTTCIPFLIPNDIRWRYELGGGAMMDIGCYAVNMLRFLAGGEPEVTRAEVKTASPDVDRYARVDYRFENGASGRTTASLFSARLLQISARVEGERGSLWVFNPLAPQLFHLLRVRTAEGSRTERLAGEASYTAQLRGFLSEVRGESPAPTSAGDAVANMRVIDAVYRKAGLRLRGE